MWGMRPCQRRSPVAVVHRVSEPGRVNDGERQLDAALLDQDLGLLHLKSTKFTLLATGSKSIF